MPARACFLILALAVPVRAAAPPAKKPPEAVKMAAAILSGKMPGPPHGWFGPAQTRYDWDWLAQRCGVRPTAEITPATFPGTKDMFARLDRDGDGKISRADLDPRSRRPSMDPRERMLDMVIGRADRDGDGRLSAKEWQSLFEQSAGEKGEMTREDLRRLLIPTMQAKKDGTKPPPGSGMPSRWTLMYGLLTGEIGSMHEGPSLGEAAPEFTLKTYDGKRTISLSDYRDKRPVVLIFGSFTSRTYRAQFGLLEALKKRYADRADFLGVYVREAHPSDGWRMASNDKAGVVFRQPRSTTEREAVATKCSAALNMTIPLVVDEIDDRVGHAYSGMPDRLYIVGRDGKVVYKGGRGPFGFSPAEMEQSLVMCLMETREGKK